jgi:hypothetical protein
MSLSYSDTTNKDGLLQRIEQELGFPDGYITGDTTRKAQWTGSLNLALDKAFHIIFKADGRWQFDDANHTTYPILTGNLVDGQRDYSFTADSDGNVILDIHKVLVRSSTTSPYEEIYPVDVQSGLDVSEISDGLNTEGMPYRYDKTATGIFLDPIPNANVTAGIKIYVSREGSYFATSDTTKTPGFSGLYHEYLVLEPAYRYARANNLTNREVLKRDVLEMEKKITEFYSRRSKDERQVMRGRPINFV